MAVFSLMLESALRNDASGPPIDGFDRLILVAPWIPTPAQARLFAPGIAHWRCVVESRDQVVDLQDEQTAVQTVFWDRHARPGFGDTAKSELRGIPTVWFHRSLEAASGRMLRDLHRIGVKHAIFEHHDGWKQVLLTTALWRKAKARILNAAVDETLRPDQIDAQIDRFAATLRAAPISEAVATSRIEVLHSISSLEAGGAERQAAMLCRAQAKRGDRIALRTMAGLHGGNAHYLRLLDGTDVTVAQAGSFSDDVLNRVMDLVVADDRVKTLLPAVPSSVRRPVLDMVGELVQLRPKVLHCWLDEPNIYGAIAGLIAGTDRIVLSTRNVNPTNFPGLHQPWMRSWYRLLLDQSNVQIVANSLAGRVDYARWIGCESERIIHVPNVIDVQWWANLDRAAVDAIRLEFDLNLEAPLIVGVFRLAAEKDPLVFVRVVKELHQALPSVRCLIVGTGPMDQVVREEIHQLGLHDCITLTGRRSDVREILALADVVLLTSVHEGTPNCLLEALAAQRPVVATNVGSVQAIVDHGQTGLLCEPGDLPGLSGAVCRLLRDRDLAQSLARRGCEHVKREFAIDAAVHTMDLIYANPRSPRPLRSAHAGADSADQPDPESAAGSSNDATGPMVFKKALNQSTVEHRSH